MKTFQTTRRVAHSADDMFALVADMERYPEFLPLCRALKLKSREFVEGREVLTSDMTVAYKFLRETFSSRVTLDRSARRILVEYLDGPFTHMENRWEFEPLEGRACNVRFFISYEFKSAALQMMMGGMFDQAFRKFAEAFEVRADEIYGTDDKASAQVDFRGT